MQELLKKLEQVSDMLKALKPQTGSQPSLVPAIKPPTMKPISMPSASSVPAPKKIPGLTPPSNRDPKKVAEQLKNPRPKAPKIEMLKYNERGQWSLHKDESGINSSDEKEA